MSEKQRGGKVEKHNVSSEASFIQTIDKLTISHFKIISRVYVVICDLHLH